MTLRIRNWERWQSYRSDRNQPPWIKIHRRLMHDPNWVLLTDKQRGQLVSLWMLAAERAGEIPEQPELLRQLCHMSDELDLKPLIEKGFIDASMTPKRRRHDANATPQTRLDKTRPDENASLRSDANVSQETFPPVQTESPSGLTTKYHFESGIIKLRERDFSSWEKAFSYLDLRAELIALTPWADREGSNWFHAVSGALAKRNREQKNKVTAAKEHPHKWRSGIEGVV